ncbi:integrase [Bradyrhizobium sp. AZCC 1610]|uniref:tyrosine-type recombinase/integrase n=1 Tax=Bradyrhizobium sp. AZCC 1610 TaxID=3117020 RepID=UPI002FF3F012
MRFTDLEGKRAQMEFARAGDRDSASGDVLTLSSAREKARDYKVGLKREGIDPRVKKRATAQGSKTFKEFAEEQYPVWCQGLSEEELKQWRRSVRDVPSLHDKNLQEITTEHVLEALKAIWTVKPITASRTRQRIERLMDAAKALRLRTGENPAAWRGNLKHLLPSPRKLNRKKGHRSAPYTKMPQMMTGLRYDLGNAARCTEVGILTVSRSQEIRLMEWTELDFEARTWMVPAEKMKIKGELESKPHLVPLSDQAIEIIQSMRARISTCSPPTTPSNISRSGRTRLWGPSSALPSNPPCMAAARASEIGALTTRSTISAAKCSSSACRTASAMRLNYRIGTAR